MKKLLVAIIILLLASTVVIYYYSHHRKLKDFEPQIKEKLNQLVMEASNGLYHLEIEKLEGDVVNSKITLINAHLKPDTLIYAKLEQAKEAPNDLFDITIGQLSIDDVVPAEFIVSNTINLRRLFINKPVISVRHKKQPYNISDSTVTKTIFQRIQSQISKIQVDTIILQDIDFSYKNLNKKDKVTSLTNVKLFLSDILLDSSTQFDRERFFFARNCLINIKDYIINTPDSLYRLKIGEIDIHTSDETVQLKKLQFVPRVPAQTFYKRVKHQKDRFDLNIGQVNLSRINWWTIMEEESFQVEKMSIRNGLIKVSNDKSQPATTSSKVGRYPHQLVMKLPFKLKVDSLTVSNFDLSYTELNPKSGESASFTFDNIQGLITNVTNEPEQIKKNQYTRIVTRAMFMNKTPVTSTFMLDLSKYKNGNFNVTASVGTLNADVINPITVPLGMLKVNSFNMKSLDVSVKGNNYNATANIKMVYDGLKVTALKATGDTLKKRGLLSFIANTFVIKKENPFKNQPIRIENVTYQRDTTRAFFNMVWKTIFTGAGKTAGYKVKK